MAAVGIIIGLTLPGVGSAMAAPVVRAAVESAECIVEVPGGSRCGELTVPLTVGVPDAPDATLPYVVVPAVLDTGRTPIVYLAGGTPLSAVDVRGLAIDRGLAADRDVVFVERRGGADASPSVRCEPAVDALASTLAGADEREAGVATITEALTSCATTWQEDGVTAADFGAWQSAADLRSLREQLGYARWTIMAVGTSASVAVAAPGADPAGVDGIVLDGPDLGAPGIVSAAGVAAGLSAVDARRGVPDDASLLDDDAAPGAPDDDSADPTASGETLSAAAASESDAAAPGVDPFARSAEVLAAAAAELEQHPRTTVGSRTITVGPDALLVVASRALADPVSQAALPYALESAADGRSGALDAIAAAAYTSLVGGDPVQDWILSCSTVGWPGSSERVDEAAPDATTLLQDIGTASCASLGIAPTPPPSAVGLASLVITAPEQEAALGGLTIPFLPDAVTASFPGAGAVPTATSECAVIAVRSWLTEPAAYRAALCAVDDAAVAVVQSADVSASQHWVRQATSGPGGWWLLLAVPGLFGVVAIGWSVAWAYRLITQALRREPVQDGLRLGIAPVFGASWAIAGAATLIRAADSSPATQLLGVPAALPWLSIVLLVSCIGLVPVWQGAHRGARLRIALLSLLWAATAVWAIVFVLAWW